MKRPTKRHTLIFSDFHLAPAAAPDPVWMRYRNPRYFVDRTFQDLTERLLGELQGAPFEVVFNGDLFELDGADGFERHRGRRYADVGEATVEARSLDQILSDHNGFVDAVGRLLVRAERVVFLAGNHDIGLYWPAVQEVLRRHLVAAAMRNAEGSDPATFADRIAIRQWFYRTAEGIFVEHGQQHDTASALPDPLLPTRRDGRGLLMSLGSVGFRYILGGIGTMNPHVHHTFVLGLVGYVRHFMRYYYRTSRQILRTWLRGSLACTRHLLGQRHRRSEPASDARRAAREAAAIEAGLPVAVLDRLADLEAPPITHHVFGLVRELWLDRLLGLGVLALLSVLALIVLPGAWGLLAPVVLGLSLAAYERLAPASNLDGFEKGLPRIAEAIATLTNARAVVFGHTHHPDEMTLESGVRLLNTGTWAPCFVDPECTLRVNAAHTFAWLRSEGGTLESAELLAWERGEIVAYEAVRERLLSPVLVPVETEAQPA